MKKYIIILMALIGMATQSHADACDHKKVTVSEDSNYNLVFHCKDCNKDIDYKTWTQNEDPGLTVTDPFLNMDADLHDIGQQMVYITSSSSVLQAWLLRNSDSKILGYLDKSSSPQPMAQFNLPRTDEKCDVSFVCQMVKSVTKTGEDNTVKVEQDTIFGVTHFTYLPFHSIRSVDVKEIINKDSVGIMHPYNQILFSINAPDDDDVMSADHFVVYRSKTGDFSDAETLGSFEIGDYSYSTTVDGKKIGWFRINDKSELATYNETIDKNAIIAAQTEGTDSLINNEKFSDIDKHVLQGFYTHPSQPVYYRVERAMVESLWSTHRGEFIIDDSINVSSQLASASKINVVQDKYWANNKKVTVRVSLDNPMPWDYNELEDKATIKHELENSSIAYRRYVWNKDARIHVTRYSPEKEWENGVDLAAMDYYITGDKVRWVDSLGCWQADVADCQSMPYTHYYYKAIVEQNTSVNPLSHNNSEGLSSADDAEKSYSKSAALISDFTASQGEYPGKVVLKWQLGSGNVDKLNVYRREWSVNKKDQEWTRLDGVDAKATDYLDKTALSGHAYQYMLTTSLNYRLQNLTDSAMAMGWGSYMSSISGKIVMPNGAALANRKVTIKRTTPVFIDDVVDENGKIIMYGYHDGIKTQAKRKAEDSGSIDVDEKNVYYTKTIYTDELGRFDFDSLAFMGEGTKYIVSFDNVYKHSGTEYGEIEYKLSDEMNIIEDQKFICSSVATFSGSVLYTKSTVPVGGAHFVMYNMAADKQTVLSKAVLRNADGEMVTTDTKGEFSFSVPAKSLVKIRVEKEGHTFDGGGCLLSGTDSVFTTQAQSYVIPQVGDKTRVRLVGRLCGGTIEANKELGFSKSKNNLGDEMTIELQLEGNNTSWIVFDDNDPDNTTIEQTVKHPFKGIYASYSGDLKTRVTYEKKRITIHPDSLSGEFFVDLIPTKYRVTKLLATGYPTLYQSGQGLEILDLSDSCTVKTIQSINDANQSYERCATYIKPYHVGATVTLQQYKYGDKTGYLGEDYIENNNILGEKVKHLIASYDKTTGKADYTFGYPLFVNDKSYMLEAYAHEDFYYNNDKNNIVDEVPLENGVLHVQNGLLDTQSQQKYDLNSQGRCNFSFTVGNPTFALTGDAALRSLNASVELNDYYYEAEPLRAFVTGHLKVGTDALPIAKAKTGINVVDVLRDPPGSSSYAYREAGTTYNWKRNFQESQSMDLKTSFDVGRTWKINMGTGFMLEAHTGVLEIGVKLLSLSTTWPLVRDNERIYGEYQMTLSERIQTGSDIRSQGAMADIYIGTVDVLNFYRTKSFNVIDQTTYDIVKEGIGKSIKLVSQSKGSDDNKQYLVISDIVTIQDGIERSFAYTQKHILSTIIPEIDTQVSALILDGDSATFQGLANDQQKVYYLRDSSRENGYKPIFPQNPKDGLEDEVAQLLGTKKAWQDVIYNNESTKVNLFNKKENLIKPYSVAGAQVSYNESYSGYYNDTISWEGAKVPSSSVGTGNANKGGSGDFDENAKDEKGNKYKKPEKGEICGAGFSFGFDIGLTANNTTTGSMDFSRTQSLGYGFVLGTNDNGYMDVDVYGETQDVSKLGLNSTDLAWIQKGHGEGDAYKNDAVVHNYVFYARSGAARNPWYAPDSTLFYTDGSGNHVPLGARLLKIDNPRIYIDHPIVNNQPEDEAAEFRIRLTNDTETNMDTKYLNPSSFTLYVKDSSNPNGAEVKMDGAAIASGRSFSIPPGNSLEKVVKIDRGVGYDFNNIQFVLSDASYSLSDSAAVSVHYLPVASKVNISSPENKWTMNTLSSYDVVNGQKKYFIPVNIDGFNVNSDGFHHIELQYKKDTDGESKWTCVRGFYNDSTLYRQATGEKEMIPSTGKISNLKFYGENDPVEMNYDLRAVAFRKLGTGFVTRTSDVMSGVKDTRCPTVFGSPSPANGILTYADVISIPFNEPIAYNYLDKTANFQVMGQTNGSDRTFNTALNFSVDDLGQNDDDIPASKVTRSLAGNDFTIDMMLKRNKVTGNTMLFSVADENNMSVDNNGDKKPNDKFMFFLLSEKNLLLYNNGYFFISNEITADLSSGLNRIGLTFTQPENTPNGEPQVKFYVNGLNIGCNDKARIDLDAGTIVDDSKVNLLSCNAEGKVYVGYNFDGCITDMRLWNRALPPYEIVQKRESRVNTNDLGLIAHWPMDEGSGNMCADEVNGAHLYFNRQSWQSMTKQFALHLDGKKVQLRNAEEIQREQSYDYTVSLWTRYDALDADSVDIFRTGEWNGKQFFRIGTKENKLILQSRNSEVGEHSFNIADKEEFNEGQWHNIIVVANKSQNTGAIYYDGNMVESFNGDELGGLAETNIWLGDNTFHGHLDNITVWDHAFPNNSISTLYNRCASGYEIGLRLNLPFEKPGKNPQGSYDTVFSGQNMVYKLESRDTNGNYPPCDSVFTAEVMSDDNIKSANVYCPLEPVTDLKNLDFTWTATDNALQINLLQNDADINHQNITVVVRGVEDKAGNSLQNPQRIVLYVDKNVLKWNDKHLNLEKTYMNDTTLTVKFGNESGRKMNYHLYEYSSWLSLDTEYGTINPLDEKDVTITIDKNLAPGEYFTTLYLQDENNLYAQLPIQLTVTATAPEWEVTTDPAYKYQMNVTGQVKLKNDAGKEYIDMDSRDIVYAFLSDGTCLGKANLTVKDNESFVYLTVKGSQQMCSSDTTMAADVQFRLWRASTGNTTYLTPKFTNAYGTWNVIQFAKNTNIGTHDDPVIFSDSNSEVQTINLKKGWNWISLYVNPAQHEGVNGLFESTKPFTAGDMITVFGADDFSVMQDDGLWSSGKDGLQYSPSRVYQVYANNDMTARVIGSKFSDNDRTVTLKNKGWNDLAYLLDTSKPLKSALGSYMQGATIPDKTIIMSRDEFSMTSGGNWYGSLEYLHPGQGYYIYHQGDAGATITYYDDSALRSTRSSRSSRSTLDSRLSTLDSELSSLSSRHSSHNHKSAMPVIAVFADDVHVEDGDELIAYAGENLIGTAKKITLDSGESRYFIMLESEEGSQVTWVQKRNGETIASAKSKLIYRAMGVVSSIEKPYVVNFNSAEDTEYYTPEGIKVQNVDNVHDKVLIGTDGTKIFKKK